MQRFDLKRFPTSAGVYLMKDDAGAVLYVGKAKQLRNRLRNYFTAGGDSRPQVRFLLERVRQIETIVTDTEKEALILENTLIKQYRPRYNIDLRDDKTYVSIRLDPREEFPTLQMVRQVKKDGALYFGPYSSAAAVRETLKEIYRIFPLRRHPLVTCRRRSRPCLFFQIGQCSAPCHGHISPGDYAELVRGVTALLSGHDSEVLDLLRRRMQAAAAALRFEEAARLRDQVAAVLQTVERQKVVEAGGGDQDVFGLHREGGEVEVAVLFIRQGKLLGRRTFPLVWKLDEAALLAGVLQQLYGGEVLIPDELVLPAAPEGAAAIADWLSEKRGKKVALLVPQRGDKVRLLQLAERNALESFRERGSWREAREGVLEEVRQALQLRQLPRRMECYDISNVQGSYSVGSMVVVLDGEPAPAEYRSFQIRTVTGADDYASLYEVLKRRLRRGLTEGGLPDFILMDGGKGQLAVLAAVLEELDLGDRIEAAGIAKSRVTANVRGKRVERSDERFFRPGRLNPVVLRAGSAALFLLIRLRDEAHRFALAHHRKLRQKAAIASPLDAVPGIGPARRKALLKHFGSLRRIQAATVEELREVAGISAGMARAVLEHFQKGSGELP